MSLPAGPQLALQAPVILFAAGILGLLFSLFRWKRLIRGVTATAAALAFISAVAGAVTSGMADQPVQLVPIPVLPQLGHLRLDRLAVGWLAVSSLLPVLLMIFFRKDRPNPNSDDLDETPQESGEVDIRGSVQISLGLLLACCSQVVVLADSGWIQWGATAMTGWLCCFAILLTANSARERTGVAAVWIWWTVADFCWLFGLQLMSGLINPGSITFLPTQEGLGRLDEDQFYFVGGATLPLVASLAIRSAIFPAMIWTRRISWRIEPTLWVIPFGLGTGLLVLLRWADVLRVFPATSQTLAGLGCLSALLLGFLGCFQSQPASRFLRVAGGQIGLVWAGLAAATENTAWLGDLSVSLLLLLTCAGCLMSAATQTSVRSGRWPLWLILGTLTVGVAGQERVLETIRTTPLPLGLSPAAMLTLSISGIALMSWTLFRMSVSTPVGPEASRTTSSRWSWVVAAIGVLGTTGLLVPWPGLGSVTNIIVLPTFGIILTTVAALGMLLPVTPRSSEETQAETKLSLVRRLAESELSLSLGVQFLIIAPTRGLARLLRFFEQSVTTAVLLRGPQQLIAYVSETLELTDEVPGELAHVRTLLVATGVLLLGVLWGWL